MDTATVLEIIKMIEVGIHNLEIDLETYDERSSDFVSGKIDSLKEFRDHLQSFIEGQLNGVENSAPY